MQSVPAAILDGRAEQAAPRLAPDAGPAALHDDPLWYKDAVIYELHIKAYADANGDGIGDFRGLTEHLDHVESLGVNTIWLLPFYPSPLRDDGYDVSDYEGVHPSYGTLDDFRGFIAQAHRRGLRVITELVLNHTSDQHPWFQAARKAPRGSPQRNFYVWSDDTRLYSGTRIIFTDTEKSNWTWDEVAQQFYWHRFFSHQPDLNFDNPAVIDAVLKTMEFWLRMGVDGFRLDAVPYLVERDGTSNENLRETHAVIKQIRARIDAEFPGRLLLAEANMWPEDVREYFGDGDECQMAYHFPLMPRMYMAIAQEDRHPVVEILAQTPDIPPSCQWAVFLRNHDELTLEMVTSKERDYMYSMYASDSRARINLGIRRRLAPLLENDRDRIELMNSLLLSMPGTPVLYYGDEIGMGDNIFLGDRDGVRTPMQWTSDRNGGFSRADPQRLYLPPIQDPIYGYEAVNVEAQAREPSSLLNWTRRLLAVRRSTQAFGRGSFTILKPGNRKVLAYVREHRGDSILCVANLSRTAQPVELELDAWKARVPVEMLGRNAFPPIGDLPYLLTLPAYGFFWFRLATDARPPQWHTERLPLDDLAVVVLFDGWNSFFRGRVVPWRMALAEKTRAQLEGTLLPGFLARQRWFGPGAERPDKLVIVDHVVLKEAEHEWLLALAQTQGPGAPQRYFLPLALAYEDRDEERMRKLAALALAKVRRQAEVGIIGDAMADEPFCRALVRAIGQRCELRGDGGVMRFVPGARFAELTQGALSEGLPVHRLTAGRHSVSLLGDKLFLKGYRRLQPGIHPELKIGRFLTDGVAYPNCAAVAGNVEFHAADGEVWTVALLQQQLLTQGDAWGLTVDQLERALEAHAGPSSKDDETTLAAGESIRVMARRIAELHVALSRTTGQPDFDPEPVTAQDMAAWSASVVEDIHATLGLLDRRADDGPQDVAELTPRLIEAMPALLARAQAAARAAPVGLKTRLHGNLHLGQLLVARDDFVIIGFGGGAQRNAVQRWGKHSALRDVADMLRSFDHARHTALQQSTRAPSDLPRLAPMARTWQRHLRAAFLETYGELVLAGGLYPAGEGLERAGVLIELFELEQALRELRHEIDHRPERAIVPLAAIAALAGLPS